jgi:hypothetical protein
MDAAALEDEPDMQSKWAALLSNMVDSEKNIQNHVFPYILGQLSLPEFALLDACVREKLKRTTTISQQLSLFNENSRETADRLTRMIALYDKQIAEQKQLPSDFQSMKTISRLSTERRNASFDLITLKNEGRDLEYKMSKPQVIPDDVLEDFEMSNLIRLGLAKFLREPFAEPVQIDIPIYPEDDHLSTEADVIVDYTDTHVVTELAELLIMACSEESDA